MKRLAIAAFAWAALHASAFENCDNVGVRPAMTREAKEWYDALKEKRYAELEAKFGALVSEAGQGDAGDGKAESALRAFERLDEWREARHRDWEESYPRSAAALLARAHFHVGRALSLRARGKVQGEDHEAVMRAEFSVARESLGRADRLLHSHALTDATRIRIAAAEDGHDAAVSLARRAIASNPTSLAVRMAQVATNGDEWGGRRADLVAIPGQATALSAADRRYLEYLVFSYLGKTELAAGHRSLAIKHFARAEPLCPALEYPASELAKLYLADRRFEAAIPMADHVIRDFPTDGLGYMYRGLAYRGLGKNGEAVKELQHAVDLGRTEAFGELAWFYEMGKGVARDLGKALELYAVGEARDVSSAREGAQRVRAEIAKGVR